MSDTELRVSISVATERGRACETLSARYRSGRIDVSWDEPEVYVGQRRRIRDEDGAARDYWVTAAGGDEVRIASRFDAKGSARDARFVSVAWLRERSE